MLGKVVVILMASLLLVAPTAALATDIEWQGGNGDLWSEPGNWEFGQIPTENDNAILDNGTICVIPGSYAAETGTIYIASGNTVRLRNGTSLTLGDGEARTSEIHGILEIGRHDPIATGSLKIWGNHSIVGDGGSIRMFKGSVIEAADDPDTDHLTIEGSCTSSPAQRDCSLVVFGWGDITVGLHNDAFVIGYDPDATGEPTSLIDAPKTSGCSGYWMSELGGNLFVGCRISGEGTWLGQNSDWGGFDGGNIYIGSQTCVLSEGAVNITGWGAYLEVNGCFCTTGPAELGSVDDDGYPTDPSVNVIGTDNRARFGAASCEESLTLCTFTSPD